MPFFTFGFDSLGVFGGENMDFPPCCVGAGQTMPSLGKGIPMKWCGHSFQSVWAQRFTGMGMPF